MKPGEFILGYPDEAGPPRGLPQPVELVRNGTYMAYRRLEEHVGRFREFLREHGQTPEGEELLALMAAPTDGEPPATQEPARPEPPPPPPVEPEMRPDEPPRGTPRPGLAWGN